MSIHENKGSFQTTKTQTEELKFVELKPKLMGPEAMEEIINHTIKTINTDPKEFVMKGNGRKISYLNMLRLNKAPKDFRTQAVAEFVRAIPSAVDTIYLKKLPLPECTIIKEPSVQELSMIIEAQKINADVQIVYEMNFPTEKPYYGVQEPNTSEAYLNLFKKCQPEIPIQNLNVVVQKFYTPQKIQ
jgi:hypothetical protein